MGWYSFRLMRFTYEGCAPICLFWLYPRIRSAIDDIPFSEREDEETFDPTLITSLEADAFPVLAVTASSTISSPI